VDVNEVLRRYRFLTRSKLLRYLPARQPARYLYDLLPTYPLQGGKALRPALCLATCQAYGKSAEKALPAAVALELLHNAFLVHDDIADAAVLRRGRPALHAAHGVAVALNAGDALAVFSIRPLLDGGLGRLSRPVLEEFLLLARETLEGQAMELGWIRDNSAAVTVAEYLAMVAKKTSWYTVAAPCRIGALIGSGGRADVARFTPFALYLGAAFQIGDDLLGMAQHRGPDNDLCEGKRTLMLIHLLDHATAPERARLMRFLGLTIQARRSEPVEWIVDLMDQRGSIDFARRSLVGFADAAAAAFEPAFGDLPRSEHRDFLEALVRLFAART